MAFTRATVRLATVFLLSLPAGMAVGLADARLNAGHLQAVTRKQENADLSQMKRLIVALGGDWTTEDTYEASGRVSGSHLEHSRESYRAGPAYRSLIEEYHGEENAGQSWGTGIFWWDDKAQGVYVLWCDSAAVDRGCRVLSGVGKWEGKNFVQTDVNPEPGKQVFTREVWSDLKRDSFTQTIYRGTAADKLEKIVTIRATRKH